MALNYPNSQEGKYAEELLQTDLPAMEALKFYEVKPLSWKILYKSNNPEDANTKKLQEKIKKFIEERGTSKLSVSYDVYTMDQNFVVIHGLKSDEYAKGIASILKEFKEYKIPDTAYIISNENYKIVQMKKNFEEFLTTPYSDPLPPKAYVPKSDVREPKKAFEPKRAAREEVRDEKQSEFNQLPPGMPLVPGSPDSSVKQKEQRTEKK